MAKRNSHRRGSRAVRNKTEVSAELSITSLLDVLTIILVFLIKNVSMEAVRISEITGIKYPPTITKDAIIKNPEVVPVKIYLDHITVGQDELPFGTPADLFNDNYDKLLGFLRNEYEGIPDDKKNEACLVVQADAGIKCMYISKIVAAATLNDFPNIYFATSHEEDWLRDYRPNLAGN